MFDDLIWLKKRRIREEEKSHTDGYRQTRQGMDKRRAKGTNRSSVDFEIGSYVKAVYNPDEGYDKELTWTPPGTVTKIKSNFCRVQFYLHDNTLLMPYIAIEPISQSEYDDLIRQHGKDHGQPSKVTINGVEV